MAVLDVLLPASHPLPPVRHEQALRLSPVVSQLPRPKPASPRQLASPPPRPHLRGLRELPLPQVVPLKANGDSVAALATPVQLFAWLAQPARIAMTGTLNVCKQLVVDCESESVC